MATYMDHALGGSVTAVQVATGATPSALATALGAATASAPAAGPMRAIAPSGAARATPAPPASAPVPATVGGSTGSLNVAALGFRFAAKEDDWVVTFADGKVCVFTTPAFNSRFSAS